MSTYLEHQVRVSDGKTVVLMKSGGFLPFCTGILQTGERPQNNCKWDFGEYHRTITEAVESFNKRIKE